MINGLVYHSTHCGDYLCHDGRQEKVLCPWCAGPHHAIREITLSDMGSCYVRFVCKACKACFDWSYKVECLMPDAGIPKTSDIQSPVTPCEADAFLRDAVRWTIATFDDEVVDLSELETPSPIFRQSGRSTTPEEIAKALDKEFRPDLPARDPSDLVDGDLEVVPALPLPPRPDDTPHVPKPRRRKTKNEAFEKLKTRAASEQGPYARDGEGGR